VVAAAMMAIAILALPVMAQQKSDTRDEFFWLGQINKATAVINTDEGLLDKAIAPRIAAGVARVIEEGSRPGGERPSTVITFEPLLIKAAGPEVTLLHAGRSSQDMHATYRAAILRDGVLGSTRMGRRGEKMIRKANLPLFLFVGQLNVIRRNQRNSKSWACRLFYGHSHHTKTLRWI